MTVNMPVEVLCEKCVNCPELDVNTITEARFDITGITNEGEITQINSYNSALRCANVEKCRILYDTVFANKETEKETKKSTTTKKKPATRRKQASK